MQFRLHSILLTIFVALILLFLLIAVSSVFINVKSIIIEQFGRSHRDLVYNNILQLTERLNQIEETALSISVDRTLVNALESKSTDDYRWITVSRELNDLINNHLYIKPYLNSIRIYCDSPLARFSDKFRPLSAMPWAGEIERFDRGNSAWIPVHDDPNAYPGDGRVLTFVMAVIGRGNDAIGYVEVNISEQDLWAGIRDRGDETDENVRVSMLLDRNWRLMSTLSFGHAAAPPSVDAVRRADAANGGRANELIEADGEQYLYINSPKSVSDWRLVNLIPVRQMYKEIDAVRNFILLIGFIVLVLAFVTSLHIAKWINRPVKNLLKGFERIESGDFNVRMGNHFIFEFDQLSIRYNRMTGRLQELIGQVKEEHRLKREAEFKMLQSQINPHFLYNTLDMINWTASKNGVKDISVMVTKLSQLFRIGLKKSGPLIKLRDELRHASLYAQIQQIRFRERFEYIEDIPDGYKDFYVPRFIIQPFVENAIIHGFKDKMDEIAQVKVFALADPHRLSLFIVDNGRGLPEDGGPGNPSASHSGGQGIRNVDERIKIYCGSEYGVRLSNAPSGGLQVEITLPCIPSLDGFRGNLTAGDEIAL